MASGTEIKIGRRENVLVKGTKFIHWEALLSDLFPDME